MKIFEVFWHLLKFQGLSKNKPKTVSRLLKVDKIYFSLSRYSDKFKLTIFELGSSELPSTGFN